MNTDRDGDPSAVVVPAITAPSSVACVRSLGRRGVHPIVVSEDTISGAPLDGR